MRPPRPAPQLLTDAQMRRFVTDGVLLLHMQAPAAFYTALLTHLDAVWQQQGDPGHALIPLVPEAAAILTDPVIDGALRSVLGTDYLVDPCRHIHLNNHPEHGPWHQDDYCGTVLPPERYPWRAMLCIMPQDTPPERGPTGCMPGSQWSPEAILAPDVPEVLVSGPAGTCALLRFDLWHRATANVTGEERVMLKFLFARQTAPTQPSWACQERAWQPPTQLAPTMPRQETLWREVWDWLCGQGGHEREES